MKKDKAEMLPEYDFTGLKGTRGKYARAYKKGHSVRVFDGKRLVTDQYFAAIESDIREYFPDSKSINNALRGLIKIMPKSA